MERTIKKPLLIYILLGIILILATIFTASKGLSKNNIEIYKEALSMQSYIDKLGFKGFNLSNFRVRFYNGKSDYVIYADKIEKENAVLDIFAATSIEVNGEYQVLLPTFERFSEMFSMFNTANLLIAESENYQYSKADHINTLWHEAFHTYQFTYFEDSIRKLFPYESIEETIVEHIDTNEIAVELLSESVEKLLMAYYAQDDEATLTLIKEYFEITDKRKEIVGSELANVEEFYKTIEGSASYIEANSYMTQNNRKMFEERYILDFNYTNGASKYYNIGMLECFILDKLDKGWKDNYDFSKTIDDVLREKLE